MPPGQSILITGATSGIGRDAALRLARAGHLVLAGGRRPDALAALAREARGRARGRLEPVTLDVTDPASVGAARALAERRTGGRGLDVLVNNAGYALPGPLEALAERDLRQLFDTNVFGLLAVTRAFVPAMRERGQGRVVNVGSIMGRVAMPLLGAYNATKHAVAAMTDTLRMELAPFGITVVLVEPGAVRTGFAAQGPGRPGPLPRPGLPVRHRPRRHRRRLVPRLPLRPRPRLGGSGDRSRRHRSPPGRTVRGPRPQPPGRGRPGRAPDLRRRRHQAPHHGPAATAGSRGWDRSAFTPRPR